MEYKYYKGEAENPFSKVFAYEKWLFWEGEKFYHDEMTRSDNFHKDRVSHYRDWLKSHPDEKRGIMGDPKVSEDIKAMVLFIDAWHQKWFPYENGAVIFEY